MKLICQNSKKNQWIDAELLALLARSDRKLLSPIEHRGEEAQVDLMAVRVRAQLVQLRTQAANAARGLVESFGQRLAACDADQYGALWERDEAVGADQGSGANNGTDLCADAG